MHGGVVLEISAAIRNHDDAERAEERRKIARVTCASETPRAAIRLVARGILAQSIRRIARVERLVPKVKVKLDFMMACALDAARRAEPTAAGRISPLEARFPKLPECYRSYLQSFAEEFGKGRWG